MAGEGELNRVIKDLQKTVAELKCSYQEQNVPVTDGSRELHSLCAQLEFLLQEKRSFFGQRKDYWDFLCQGLARCRQEHEGIHFVTSLDKLKTPVGRGRAFLRYCLVHRQLAESLQLCLLDPESLCEWYYARSPFLSPERRAEILGSLYELDCVTFHLALHRSDLDTAWPMFSEPLVRPSAVTRSSPARTALQTDRIGTVAHGWPGGTGHPTVALHGALAHPCPPILAALQAGSVEMEDREEDVEDGEVKKDVEEEDEEEVEKDDSRDTKEVKVEDVKVEDVEVDVEEDLEEKHEELEEDEKEMKDMDVEELKDAHGTAKAARPDGAGEPGTSPLSTGTRCMLGSPSLVPRQPGGTEEPLPALVSRLRAELAQREAAARALAARLARAELRHRRQEEGSARRAQLWAREAEALRETNTFLQRALRAAVAPGDPGALARAQEEARGWQGVAEERGAQLARARAEAAALTSRLRECQEALAAAGRTDMVKDAGSSDEVAAVEEVLRQALELARGPQESPGAPQAEGEPSTVTSMAMRLASLAATAQEETWQSRQQLQAQRQEMARLQEELSRARQDGERWAAALQRAQREALEREATRGAEQARQQELIRDMKGRLLELLREKDALWQKTEGIDTPMPSAVPRDPGLCARCRKDFRLLSRRYSCRWAVRGAGLPLAQGGDGSALTSCSPSRLCQGKVCHSCSVDMGKHGRCCLICYQQRHPQAT
ncbi:RUN and FYVE domain-containing protein 4 isoform X2 [Passer montanus]|uniref:RUN and FYVE domain-containing protein 4 isoform X2 n=1 Tax=Passer montanus TaxID=9160 RepID=UPI0019607E3D|nr:RUN and FYVE domain-containing protein 4 isoform X2 [Passer montanus]